MEDGDGARYRAFVSYSHRDQAFGRRLHRWLEHYGVPRRLVGRTTPRGLVPSRAAPIFRDREEFSAAGDLTAEVRAALGASGALIVVCSPAAAASPWVSREVELFRELHPDRPVLAALAAGDPAEAFPRPLTLAGGAPMEPLAADFRAEGDGPRLALLKLVAGVLGLGLDELIQRDAQRRLRRVTAVTAGAVAVALVMSALTVFALLARAEAQRQRSDALVARSEAERRRTEAVAARNEAERQRIEAVGARKDAEGQRTEAERQRGEAEALVEFMLTDLRDRLKGVGRLDVLGAVNARTLAYYSDQQVDRLPPASRARYARILMAMGEDDLTRGDKAAAAEKFRKADRATAALLAEKPGDPERIWARGQSEYWLGYQAYLTEDRRTVADRWSRYRGLSQRLADAGPRNPKYRRELAYAEGNLCTAALKKPVDASAALTHCAASLSEMEATARLPGHDAGVADDLINRHAWMADAHLAARDPRAALKERLAEEELLKARIAADSKNMRLQKAWVVQQKELANLEVGQGQLAQARARVIAANTKLSELMTFDPQNEDWARLRTSLDAAVAYFNRPEIRARTQP
ncbi:MAG: TIR domain-containing protein [Phenylobacterium sp.]